jgi:RES domain-containing protein
LTRVYRVLRRPYAGAPFDGEGSFRYGGRWSSPGTRVAYASEHESLAMLEYFVHLDADDAPPDLVLAVADVPDDLKRETIGVSKLPSNWRDTPAPAELVHYGDDFVQRGSCGLLLVPSALAPSENNWLMNPQHPDFGKIILRENRPLNYDPRMFHRERLHRKQSGRKRK